MPIPDFVKANFETLLRAAAAGDLALVQGTDARTGETRFIFCAPSVGTAVRWCSPPSGTSPTLTPMSSTTRRSIPAAGRGRGRSGPG